jgi:RNA polymerase sigma-70 factor (ECF subfamily)
MQETFLRAWRGWSDFAGRSSARTWLYRIATNACLDALARAERRVLPSDLGPDVGADVQRPPADGIAWLQPIPDAMLDPDTAAVARETMEIAFLAAVQHLPPRQRAALILRDAAGWTAREVADLLSTSVPAANSAVQRARATMRSRLPERSAWAAGAADEAARTLVRRYLEAVEKAG